MNVHADSKRRLPAFLRQAADIAGYLEPLEGAAQLCAEVASKTNRMAEMLPYRSPGESEVKDTDVPELIALAEKAYTLEGKPNIIEETLET